MRLAKKLRRSIEGMPRPAYIFLRACLALAAVMLWAACLLFANGSAEALHLAVLLLESPAGVLLLSALGLAFLLDRLE